MKVVREEKERREKGEKEQEVVLELETHGKLPESIDDCVILESFIRTNGCGFIFTIFM